jgi:hypothetical protein
MRPANLFHGQPSPVPIKQLNSRAMRAGIGRRPLSFLTLPRRFIWEPKNGICETASGAAKSRRIGLGEGRHRTIGRMQPLASLRGLWTPNLLPGGRLPRGYWQCPNGCNHA